jgi:RNA polymerase subunit RPABC4/transcription elongation factor Spt4
LEEVIVRSLQLMVALAGAYALALWFALVVWTYRDITARTNNPVTHVFSTLIVVLFWVPGAIIYLILRPRETLDEAFQRAMEEEYLLQDLDDMPVCFNCRRAIRDDFVFCPHCSTELRRPCVTCGRFTDVHWEICPYCGAAQQADEVAVQRQTESRQQKRSRKRRDGDNGAVAANGNGRKRRKVDLNDTMPLQPAASINMTSGLENATAVTVPRTAPPPESATGRSLTERVVRDQETEPRRGG